jgi:hypothetical protein
MVPLRHHPRVIARQQAAPHQAAQQAPSHLLLHLGDGVRIEPASVFRATAVETALAKNFTPDAAKSVKIAADGLNTDLHGSAAYRAHLVSVMASRAVEAAG